jgi:hypothetical protein
MIRCSNFKSFEGRCINCIRFGQECVFTPVATNTTAFVPLNQVQMCNLYTPRCDRVSFGAMELNCIVYVKTRRLAPYGIVYV